MCMKDPYLMMSTFILDPKAFWNVQPLIDELKEQWKNGVETYDVSMEETFILNDLFCGQLYASIGMKY